MIDSVKLRDAIKGRGVSYRYISGKMGISDNTLTRKIKNQTEFKASEISMICHELHLTEKERNAIFFAPKVE